ncbi:MAG TPA: hypothetical protein VHB97_23225 [Polyangia bacterium]|nr:hypothetical protein [Polyangia bacterium]
MKRMILVLLAALAGCGSGGVSTSTDVKLQNATAHQTSLGGNVYELTFAVVNGAARAIDRIDDVRLSTGGQPLQNATAVSCQGSPWTLAPGGSSGVVTLDVSFGAQPRLSVQCDDTAVDAATALVSPPSAPAASFDIRVEGLLTDAQPFIATATAPIQ